MDTNKKIAELTAQFEQATQEITRIGAVREQIRGQVALLQEQLAEAKPQDKTKK